MADVPSRKCKRRSKRFEADNSRVEGLWRKMCSIDGALRSVGTTESEQVLDLLDAASTVDADPSLQQLQRST